MKAILERLIRADSEARRLSDYRSDPDFAEFREAAREARLLLAPGIGLEKPWRVVLGGSPDKPAFRTRFATYQEAKRAACELNPGLAPVVISARLPPATTRAQRARLKKLFEDSPSLSHRSRPERWRAFRAFRSTVQPEFGHSKTVMVEWCGMWLGIEPDGHCHS